MDDPLLYFRPESAPVVELPDDRDYVSSDTVEQKRPRVVWAGSESSTIEPIALDALRDELTKTQLSLKDTVAATSALKSETDSLSARATEIEAASRRVQDTARAALERDTTVEQRFGAIESRLGALDELAAVRREIETRFAALAHEVSATSEAAHRQQGRVEH